MLLWKNLKTNSHLIMVFLFGSRTESNLSHLLNNTKDETAPLKKSDAHKFTYPDCGASKQVLHLKQGFKNISALKDWKNRFNFCKPLLAEKS